MPSKWIEHVKATQAKEGVTYKQAMKIAKESYSKEATTPVKPVAAKPATKPAAAPVKVKKEKQKEQTPVPVVQPPASPAPAVEVKKVKKLAKKEVSA